MTCALRVFGGPVSNRRVTEFGRPSRLFVSTTSTRRTSACWPRRSRKTLLASTAYSTPRKVGSRFPTARTRRASTSPHIRQAAPARRCSGGLRAHVWLSSRTDRLVANVRRTANLRRAAIHRLAQNPAYARYLTLPAGDRHRPIATVVSCLCG